MGLSYMNLLILPEEIVKLIKTFIFHNIKTQGKHFKNNKFISQFNSVLLQLPRIHQPYLGARILYRNSNKNFQYVKFIYCLPPPCERCWERKITGKKKFSIIEYFFIPYHYVIGKNIKDVRIRKQYYKNIYNHSPRKIENCNYL
jgi:hypothetical protein